MTRLSESAVLASEILRKWSAQSRTRREQTPPSIFSDSLEMERHDALDAVFQELRHDDPSPDRVAACRALIRHLAGTPESVS